MQNLTILASAVPEILLGASKFKVGHVTLTTPILTVFVILMLGLDIACMLAKFDHSSFSRSADMVSSHQNLNGSRDMTTPLSGMVCHPWASIYYDQPKFEVAISTCYENTKFDTKYLKWVSLG